MFVLFGALNLFSLSVQQSIQRTLAHLQYCTLKCTWCICVLQLRSIEVHCVSEGSVAVSMIHCRTDHGLVVCRVRTINQKHRQHSQTRSKSRLEHLCALIVRLRYFLNVISRSRFQQQATVTTRFFRYWAAVPGPIRTIAYCFKPLKLARQTCDNCSDSNLRNYAAHKRAPHNCPQACSIISNLVHWDGYCSVVAFMWCMFRAVQVVRSESCRRVKTRAFYASV